MCSERHSSLPSHWHTGLESYKGYGQACTLAWSAHDHSIHSPLPPMQTLNEEKSSLRPRQCLDMLTSVWAIVCLVISPYCQGSLPAVFVCTISYSQSQQYINKHNQQSSSHELYIYINIHIHTTLTASTLITHPQMAWANIFTQFLQCPALCKVKKKI